MPNDMLVSMSATVSLLIRVSNCGLLTFLKIICLLHSFSFLPERPTVGMQQLGRGLDLDVLANYMQGRRIPVLPLNTQTCLAASGYIVVGGGAIGLLTIAG